VIARVLLLMVLAATPLAAQQTVRGVVRDRVAHDAPLSGAEVLVLGSSLATFTNDRGEFSLTLPAGRHTLVAVHPLLDTLGLGELESEFVIPEGESPLLELQTPSLAEFQQARCGRELAAGEGIVLGWLGTADGTLASGATLVASWGVRRITQGASALSSDTVRTVADEFGGYVLCGVPRGDAAVAETLGVAAIRGRATVSVDSPFGSAGPLLLESSESAVRRRDLILAGTARTAWLGGRLLTETGEPVRGGRVDLRSDSTVTAVADSAGRFRLRIPRRSEQLIVRAMGRMPLQVELAVVDDEHDLGDLPMPEAAQQLDVLTVTGAAMTAERKSFEERRSFGMGNFMDDEEIRRIPRVSPNVVATRVPGASVVQVMPGDRRFVLPRPSIMGQTVCHPRFFIDGMEIGALSGSEQEFFFAEAVRIEVYSAQQAPARYTDFDGCGVVVLWTR
jgi:hypothetical protein